MSIFYKSLRVGKNGQTFYLYKFRTMVENADKIGGASTSADDPRLTKVGKFLRKYKLDELPQILNILKGDMALVGPRPTVPSVIFSLPKEQQDIILSVKPGLTDPASLWNIDEESLLAGKEDPHKFFMEEVYPQIVKKQVQYIRERTWVSDLVIIFKTFLAIVGKYAR